MMNNEAGGRRQAAVVGSSGAPCSTPCTMQYIVRRAIHHACTTPHTTAAPVPSRERLDGEMRVHAHRAREARESTHIPCEGWIAVTSFLWLTPKVPDIACRFCNIIIIVRYRHVRRGEGKRKSARRTARAWEGVRRAKRFRGRSSRQEIEL